MNAAPFFALPDELSAAVPPEARGLERDEVRLMVARPGSADHGRFRDIGRHVRPGDLIVVNTSATLPAAVDATLPDGRPAVVHFSHPASDTTWVVELRRPDRQGPLKSGRPGDVLAIPSGRLRLTQPKSDRLWEASVVAAAPVEEYLFRHGRPITYSYVSGRWPIDAYQTVFGREPGSAEMPSAGRPFTHRLKAELESSGVRFAELVLHTGVSSLEAHEPPQPERFDVPPETARAVNQTREAGGRVIAVGTTVTRALETVADETGRVHADRGWTGLVLGSHRPARVVGGLVSGWHAPDASHLDLLEAVAGPELVRQAYDEALTHRYLWHEFGDTVLFLP